MKPEQLTEIGHLLFEKWKADKAVDQHDSQTEAKEEELFEQWKAEQQIEELEAAGVI